MEVKAWRDLLRVFEKMDDPRMPRTRLHYLADIPAIAPLAACFSMIAYRSILVWSV